MITPDNATVPDMRFKDHVRPGGRRFLACFGAASMEERRKRPYFRKTKNFGGDMSYQFQSLAVEAIVFAGAAVSQKGDI